MTTKLLCMTSKIGPWLAAVMLFLLADNAYAGAAICIAIEREQPRSDSFYEVAKNATSHGSKAASAARKRVKPGLKPHHARSLYCTDSGDLRTGVFIVLKIRTKDGATKYAFGYGKTEAEALKEAIIETGRRDWQRKKSQPYQVVKTGRF